MVSPSRVGWGGIVLAGGGSSRMGASKASLEWHGSTLLRRTVGVLQRATGGPVLVVRAAGQALPTLPAGTVVIDDPRADKGPLQGISAGLAALPEHVTAAFVSATDLPFLHPAFVTRVLAALSDPAGPQVALPVAHGHPQPLAAAYRPALAGLADRLVAAGQLRAGFLLGQSTVTRLTSETLATDPVLAALDPALDSLVNVNTPDEYATARARPAPEVTVRRLDAAAPARRVRAALLRDAARAVGLPDDAPALAEINGAPTGDDPTDPLAAGDSVVFRPA